ncbi:MAG: D-alanine--poly(phosphoribitol) ligase, partial [Lachnospiraceae bacterium]|nr:D-alanine--poly(phosphoribitol) ligase [Lachnospiraceae bacterium]
DEALTATKFTQNPINTRYRELIYRTGDYGYYGEDGDIYFAGRRDAQVKRFGHRIELSEIESVADSVEGVTRSCVVADGDRLVMAYAGDIETEGLRAAIESRLPDYMMPNAIRRIDAIPVTKNGKMDRATLREMLVEE